MLGSPPLLHPEGQRVVKVRSAAQRRLRMGWVRFLRRVFQKRKSEAGRRQSRVLLRCGRVVFLLLAVVGDGSVVMVLMVATALWGVEVSLMLEGSREHVAYWPGLMGVQLRTTSPV
jgi:hypothetical protein